MVPGSMRVVEGGPVNGGMVDGGMAEGGYASGGQAGAGGYASGGLPLWDQEAGFFKDLIIAPDGSTHRIDVYSMVGLIPVAQAKWPP
jgi:hypothetical protein